MKFIRIFRLICILNIVESFESDRLRVLTNSSKSNNSHSAASQCWPTHPQWLPCAPPTTKNSSNIFIRVSITWNRLEEEWGFVVRLQKLSLT